MVGKSDFAYHFNILFCNHSIANYVKYSDTIIRSGRMHSDQLLFGKATIYDLDLQL